MSESLDIVFLEGVELYGYLGVEEKEKQDGQRFVVDLEMSVDLQQAGRTDSLSLTINYAEAYGVAKGLMAEARFDLIEAYAERLAERILERFQLAQAVRVTVRKPDAPIDGVFEAAGVRICRKR